MKPAEVMFFDLHSLDYRPGDTVAVVEDKRRGMGMIDDFLKEGINPDVVVTCLAYDIPILRRIQFILGADTIKEGSVRDFS